MLILPFSLGLVSCLIHIARLMKSVTSDLFLVRMLSAILQWGPRTSFRLRSHVVFRSECMKQSSAQVLAVWASQLIFNQHAGCPYVDQRGCAYRTQTDAPPPVFLEACGCIHNCKRLTRGVSGAGHDNLYDQAYPFAFERAASCAFKSAGINLIVSWNPATLI